MLRSVEIHGSLSTASIGIFESSEPDRLYLTEGETEERPTEEGQTEEGAVIVPSTRVQLTDEQLQRITVEVDPLACIDSGDLGINSYSKVLDLLAEMVDY